MNLNAVNKTYRNIFILLFITIFLSASCKKNKTDVAAPTIDTTMKFISASNSYIQYTGRIDFTDSAAPQFWASGVSIKARFNGPAIDIVIQDYAEGGEQNTNYYNIFIDNKLYKILPVNSNETIYKIANRLANTQHTIEIFKRTEAQIGKSVFYGFYLQKGKSLSPLGNKPTRKIEFIGDSYTCGAGNEVSIPAPPDGDPFVGFHSVNENNYESWGAITARYFNAQYHCTAFSGKGIYRDGAGNSQGILPYLYKRLDPTDANSNWKTDLYVPDIVVIHLGTNDFFPEKTASPNMVDSAAFVNTYIAFVRTLKTYYPQAKIICVVPNSQSDDFPEGMKSLTRITNYIRAVTDYFTEEDASVLYFKLPTQQSPFGEDYHPTIATHKLMAEEIEKFIKTQTSW